uniref:Uncharacterized protein n=1 Tax=Arundo donax TaxID=35708 RepID=A0A0A9ACL1_ARUDO
MLPVLDNIHLSQFSTLMWSLLI